MYKYVVTGGNRLTGKVSVSGSKNSSLPILAASILSEEEVKLYNIPMIEDVKITLKILKSIGCNIKIENNVVMINSNNINHTKIPDDLMAKLRSSVIIVGALIARFHEATFSYPGGCNIGKRPIDLHISNFEKIGIQVTKEEKRIHCICDEIESKTLELAFPSVGATENLILASILGNHEIIIKNCAKEPEITDLANFLNAMGAKVVGAGTSIIKIIGVKRLRGISYQIIPDRIEAGTLLIASAITHGKMEIVGVIPEHIEKVIYKLKEIGCEMKVEKNSIFINASKELIGTNIETMPYPEFPTDLQPIMTALLTTCKGKSIIVENIFENRFKYIFELQKMGADIQFDDKSLIVSGVKKLKASNLQAPDLRGGAALLVASLIAEGKKTIINHVDYILRGYENLDDKLNLLGANIKRVEEEV